MKNNIYINIFAALAAVCMTVSCIQETFPEGGSLTKDQLMNTEGAIQNLQNATSVAMVGSASVGHAGKYGVHYDFGLGAMHLMTEFMLEDIATPSNPGYNWFGPFASNKNMGSEYIYCSYFWEGYYQWIKLANDVIRLVPPKESSEENLVVRGEALCYRAMCYLDLARLYVPLDNKIASTKVPEHIKGLTVPIVTENTTEEDSKFNPRTPYQDIYKLIISDLKEAETLLEKQTPLVYKPGVNVARGLLARAYLELGMLYRDCPVQNPDASVQYPADLDSDKAYNEAAKYARKVIDAGGYHVLTQEQWENPTTGFNDAVASKWMWGLKLSSENAFPLLTFSAHACTEGTWGYAPLTHVSVSKKLYHSIDDNDFRKHSWLDPEFEKFYSYKFAGDAADKEGFLHGNPAIGIPAAYPYQSIKFRPAQGEVTDPTVGGCADLVLMRVEEMYFIEMEAVLQTGNLGKAQTLLNEFMQNRILDGSYNCVSKTGTKAKFITEMMLQKRIEFWGEGILIYDYKRLNQGINRGYPGSNHSADMRLDCDGRSPQWNLVISRLEFQSNTAISEENNNPDPTDCFNPDEKDKTK